jgi:hypothetical protein
MKTESGYTLRLFARAAISSHPSGPTPGTIIFVTFDCPAEARTSCNRKSSDGWSRWQWVSTNIIKSIILQTKNESAF